MTCKNCEGIAANQACAKLLGPLRSEEDGTLHDTLARVLAADRRRTKYIVAALGLHKYLGKWHGDAGDHHCDCGTCWSCTVRYYRDKFWDIDVDMHRDPDVTAEWEAQCPGNKEAPCPTDES